MTTLLDEKAVTLLERAVDIIHEGGWQRGQFGSFADTTVPHCAYGAISAAANEMECVGLGYIPPSCAAKALQALLPELPADCYNLEEEPQHPFERIFHWNDHIAKDADEVVHKLKEAAEALR